MIANRIRDVNNNLPEHGVITHFAGSSTPEGYIQPVSEFISDLKKLFNMYVAIFHPVPISRSCSLNREKL